ncbi:MULTISPECIES: YlxR family protein [Nocardiaceae]|uniref:YlxR family protein n=1 Tax=Nocardiaceae TaxID=85025 RepID=UPI001F0FFC02|nr:MULTISPECIES: YlxR family protein [Rhodococcus]
MHDSRPVRTCVGCRERAPASDLLRVVVRDRHSSESVVVPDLRHRLPGRGAWLHPVAVCLENAERRRAFGRALRVSGTVDTSEVVAFIESRNL